MNIQALYANFAPSPAAAIQSTPPVPPQAVAVTDPAAAPAATWWVSPPGQYFSVLHQISQQYPTELKSALASALGGATAPDGQAMAVVASEVAHGKQSLRRMSSEAVVPYGSYLPLTETHETGQAQAPPVSPLDRLIGTMQRMVQQSPSAFTSLATAVASNFQSVASAATGPGALAMATLASQLNQSAQMGGQDPLSRAASPEAPVPEPVAPIVPVEETPGDRSLEGDGQRGADVLSTML